MDEGTRTLTNGVKLVGEALLPGTSLLMDGKFGEGAAHAVVGIGARILLGPIGALVVAADSFSKSVTDKNLWNYARDNPLVDALEGHGKGDAAAAEPGKAAPTTAKAAG